MIHLLFFARPFWIAYVFRKDENRFIVSWFDDIHYPCKKIFMGKFDVDFFWRFVKLK